MNFFRKRRAVKAAKDVLRHARHLRNMREDVMSQAERERLLASENQLLSSIKQGDVSDITGATSSLYDTTLALSPRVKLVGLRENIEIIVVAIAVAMAVRTYFLQPFKIPTGSMHPTLFGITSRYQAEPGITDKLPLKWVKWFITGETYWSVVAKRSGVILEKMHDPSADPACIHYFIGDPETGSGTIRYRIPIDAHAAGREMYGRYPEGYRVEAGEVLWSGIVCTGDHVFVDKVRWHVREPRRDEVMVFNTDGINMDPPTPKGTHYIKRLAGLPGDELTIETPKLLVNGHDVDPRCRGILGVINGPGYRPTGTRDRVSTDHPIVSYGDTIELGEDQFYALGDNTRSSKDSRFWGPVPRLNLVGPAVIIYWPFLRWHVGKSVYEWQVGRIRRTASSYMP